jgi:hypothetical protein
MLMIWKYRLFPSWRFIGAAALWALAVAKIIDATEAPFWTFYLAPVTAAPLMLHEIRVLGARYEKQEAKKKPLADRVDQGRKAAKPLG